MNSSTKTEQKEFKAEKDSVRVLVVEDFASIRSLIVMNPTAKAGGLKESQFMTSLSLRKETTFEES